MPPFRPPTVFLALTFSHLAPSLLVPFLWISLKIFPKNKKQKDFKKQREAGFILPTLIGLEKAKDQTLERAGSGFRGRELGGGGGV